MARRVAAALLAAAATSAFVLHRGAPRAPICVRAAESEEESKRSKAKKLWDKLRGKDETDQRPPTLDAVRKSNVIDATSVTSSSHRLDEGENKDMYAALKAQRLKQLEEKDTTMADSEIYETLARKGDFPLVSKQLNEALQNRSMGTNTFLPPVLTSPDWSEFAPSSGQTPGEVISGVLRALREGNRVAEVEETENTGVPTLLRFLSPASSFGSEPVDDEDFIAFVMDSEYDILLRWEDLSFKGTMNLNVDGNRAFQTVQLQDPSGLWVKTKWALSLRDAADCKELCDTSDDGYWLIDNVMVSAR